MTDPTLRLPTSTFRVVLDLGVLPLVAPTLADRFRQPELGIDFDGESEADRAAIFIEFPDGQLHLEIVDAEVEYHFHDALGEGDGSSPWDDEETENLINWAMAFAAHLAPLLPDLVADVEEAADWFDQGLPIYAAQVEPVPLQLIEVQLEGDLLMLPWLGAGTVDHEHIDAPGDPIALLWSATEEGSTTPIARAWSDGITTTPLAEAEPGVNWDAVGLPEAEVLDWLSSLYINDNVIPDPRVTIMQAALLRIAGLA
ncbi:hypothetical protein [Glaciihabitans sp. dw_435]|uniref:hypothetical protein n=1 Tax=Glaciihabitans sp. dw_435 TaxID=2720081 RepID=UPI001BD2BB41|nr:hypothetical protein [Glaciihabitans sp. dw_435]